MSADFLVQVEKITGAGNKSCACGVFSQRLDVGEGVLGTLVGCILAKSKDSDPSTAVRDIFELAVKKLEDAQGSILDVLLLAESAASEYASAHGFEVGFVYTFFFENVCYIVKFGSGVKLLVFSPPKSVEITFESGSGPARDGQIYLLATEKFLSLFDTGDLSHEAEVDFEGIIDGIATEIIDEKNQSEIGAGFVQVKSTGEIKDIEEGEDAEDIKENEEREGNEEDENSESVSQKVDESLKQKINQSEDSDSTDTADHRITDTPKFKNPLSGVVSTVLAELSKLRHGDIRAVLRLRRNIVILAILILIILGLSAGFTLRQKSNSKKELAVSGHVGLASSKFKEGVALLDLNHSRARDILIEADHEVKLALAVDENNQKAKELSDQINSKLKETEVASNVNFETLTEVGTPITALSNSGKNLVATGDSEIFIVNTGKAVNKIPGIAGAHAASVYDNRDFIVTDAKVHRVDLVTLESKSIIDRGNALDIGVFLGNVYLLFADKIAKYMPVESGYTGPTDYLNSAMTFGGGARFAIDGSVWVTSGRQIFKFTRGEKQNFEISGLVGGAGDFGLIYTNASLKNLYVIDRTNSALLVINKDGVYKRAYQSPEFAKAAGVVVSDSEDIMYVAVGNKILSTKL